MIPTRRKRRAPWPVRLMAWIALSISDLIRFLLYTAFFIALIVAVSYWLVVKYVRFNEPIAAPDLIGLTVDEALAKLSEQRLYLQQDNRQPSTMPEGRIISQFPQPDQEIKTGTPIRVTVSSGLNLIPVPNIQGKTRLDGAHRLRSAGLDEGNVSAINMPGVAGQTIIATDPPVGTGVADGTKVNLMVASGEDASVNRMPDLIDDTIEQARERLKLLGLKAEERLEARPDAAPGKVHTQIPLPGAELTPGMQIVLITAPAAGAGYAPRRPLPAVQLDQ